MMFVLLLFATAFGQAATAFDGRPIEEVLAPSDLGWGLGTTVGSPAVIRHNPQGPANFTFIFYETMTEAPSAVCPAGRWGVGSAYTSGAGTGFIDLGPIVQPGSSYYTCVAAHPAVVNLDNNSWVVYFKAEQECAVGDTGCTRYTGLGRVVFTYNGTSGGVHQYVYSAPDPSPVLTGVAQDMGYPKVAHIGGSYRMVFGQNPDIFLVSSNFSTLFTVPVNPILSAGDPNGWGDDELFSPALTCSNNDPLNIFVGGRSWDISPAVLTDQSFGKFTTSNYTSATQSYGGTPYFSTSFTPSSMEMRHIDMVYHNGNYGLYFSSPVGAGNTIYRVTTSSFSQSSIDDKRCQ